MRENRTRSTFRRAIFRVDFLSNFLPPPLPCPSCSFNGLGVKLSNPDDDDSVEKLALVMFDTRTIKGLDFNPFSDNNVLKLNSVQEYPQDLYFILRTVLMFRGMAQARGRGHRPCYVFCLLP